MASNRNIVPQQEVEIIPSSQLPGFRESVATMTKLVADLAPIRAEAIRLAPILAKRDLSDRVSRARAGELIAQMKRIDKDGEEEMKPHKKIIKTVTDYIQTHVRRVANGAEEIRGILTPAMADWDRAETAAAKAEQDRKQRETQAIFDRQAEQKRQADEEAAKELRAQRVAQIRSDLKAGLYGDPKSAKAKRTAEKLLREAGAMEESLKARASAEEEEAKEKAKEVASTVRVETNVPQVAGNVKRINYSAECVDVDGFLSEYVRCAMTAPEKAARMRDMIQVSNQALSAVARARIKTSPNDDNPRHDLTVEQFEKLYPYVKAREDRSY